MKTNSKTVQWFCIKVWGSDEHHNMFWKKGTFNTTLKIDTKASSLKYLWSVTAAKGAVIGTSHAKKKDFCELIRVSCNKVKEHCRKKETKIPEKRCIFWFNFYRPSFLLGNSFHMFWHSIEELEAFHILVADMLNILGLKLIRIKGRKDRYFN